MVDQGGAPRLKRETKPLSIGELAGVWQAIFGALGLVLVLLLNNEFRKWLFNQFTSPHKPAEPIHQLIWLHVPQAIAIFVIIIINRFLFRDAADKLEKELRQLKSPDPDAGRIRKGTFEQFRRTWTWMWLAWLSLYIWFAFRSFRGASDLLDSVGDILNVSTGFAIWCSFLVLDMASVPTSKEPLRDRPYHSARRIAATVAVLCFLLGIADRFFQLGHVGLAAIGLYGGLGLSCLVGRLGSHYIGMPRSMLLFLYLYPMLQLCYSFVDLLDPLWTWIVFGSVLVLKVMLGFAGMDMLGYGGLDRYLKAAESGFVPK